MKTLMIAAVGALMAMPAAHAQDSVPQTNVDEIVTPMLIEEFVTDPREGPYADYFLPEGVEVVSIFPQDDDEIVEFEIDAEDGVTIDEVEQALQALQSDLTDYAKKFLGTKYVWGAKGPKAFDCSGFTGYVFKNFGYDIGPCSRVQATRGEKVDIKDARVGDLMFFSRPGGGKTVGHVGMVIDVDPENGSLKFIHASSKKGVTIQQFPDSGHYNRRFLQVRRVIDDSKLV